MPWGTFFVNKKKIAINAGTSWFKIVYFNMLLSSSKESSVIELINYLVWPHWNNWRLSLYFHLLESLQISLSLAFFNSFLPSRLNWAFGSIKNFFVKWMKDSLEYFNNKNQKKSRKIKKSIAMVKELWYTRKGPKKGRLWSGRLPTHRSTLSFSVKGFSMEQVYTWIIGERSYLKWQKKKLEFV